MAGPAWARALLCSQADSVCLLEAVACVPRCTYGPCLASLCPLTGTCAGDEDTSSQCGRVRVFESLSLLGHGPRKATGSHGALDLTFGGPSRMLFTVAIFVPIAIAS